jgi:putative phage-type endonuclease
MDPRVINLLNKPQLKQLSKEWFAARPNLITASSAASLLSRNSITCDPYIQEYGLEEIFDKNNRCCNPYSTKKQYFLDKCKGSSFKGNEATYWGQKYEPVASSIYSQLYNTEILEFGLIVHDNIKFLAASPDGITREGIMIEIKCPYRRKITGIPPLYYWIQVQLQLEVCNFDFCDFVEYSFVEFESEEEFLDEDTLDTKFIHQGLFLKVEIEDENGICDPALTKYTYPDKSLLNDVKSLLVWRDEILPKLNLLRKSSNEKIGVVYWKVDDSSVVRIKRDTQWFADVEPIFKKEWKKIEYFKKENNYRLLLKNKSNSIDGSVLHLDIGENECILSDTELN